MFKITTHNENPEFITVNLCGRFTREYVPEVEKELSRTNAGQKKLAIDLSEVTFVDRAAMAFLCAARSRKIAIQNAPLYVGLWMEQENCQTPSHSD
ncbi:MAG TPA: STAS domain-containing protein [Pyrinomonadaceae bacterium]|nr:STAS domain-containing protein [Pyrinomonadaceae bacterium]